MNAELSDEGREASPRVLIADADSATQTGIRIALEQAGLDVCGAVQQTRELLDAVPRLDPHVCLVDVDLPDDGLKAAAEIRARKSRPDVVMLASTPREEDLVKAIRLGAMGYLPKTISPVRLPAVVQAVLRGEPAIPRPLVAVLMGLLRAQGAGRRLSIPARHGVDLTVREWEVLDLLLERVPTREMASRLLISEITVRRHVSAILKKLQVNSRRDALALLQRA